MRLTYLRALHLRFGLGWNLLPLKNKRPVCKWKRLQTEFATCDELHDWFEESDFDVGIVTGKISQLVVVDCDDDAAVKVWKDFCKNDSKSKFSFHQHTRRGQHFIYKHPGGDIRNRIRVGGHSLDVRADGGYIRVHPNLHAWMHMAHRWMEDPALFGGRKSSWIASQKLNRGLKCQ